jgi:hypothetical protein
MAKTPITDYREWLVKTHHQASSDFDKAVMTLSGGALAISIAFVHDVAPQPVQGSTLWLGFSWAFLVVSLVAILAGLVTTEFALRRAIHQVDAGTIYSEVPGGVFARATFYLNVIAASTFITGVVFLVTFALMNIRNGE